jgi:hypothetical protein
MKKSQHIQYDMLHVFVKYIVHVHETRKVVRPTSGSYVHRAAFFYNVILVGHPSYLIWVNHYCLKIVMLDRSGGCVVYMLEHHY